MLNLRLVGITVVQATIVFLCAAARSAPVSGMYQIRGGTYSECCGFIGAPTDYPLPNDSQSFVRFTVDPEQSSATLTFLGADARTVFETFLCPEPGPLIFSFSHGRVLPDRTIFHVDPGPPPYQSYWNYTVSNLTATLQIEGALGIVGTGCADVPTQFTHSNLVARLVLGPRLTVVAPSKEGAVRIMVQGQAGWTDVIEASSDLLTWSPVSTNVMDFSLCPICPFAIFEDPMSTKLTSRFYRALEFK